MMQDQEMTTKLNKAILDALDYFHLPGLSVSASMGDFSYEQVVGYRNENTQEPLVIGDIFHMASVSKLFVSTAIIQLAEQGLLGPLGIETPVMQLLPWHQIADERYDKVTVRHLLTHTAGLTDVEDYGWDRPETDAGALKRYVQSQEVAGSRLLWDPDMNQFRYSNIGYEILGCVIAEASGMTFEQYMTRHIFEPLDMRNSTFLTMERQDRDRMAAPHEKDHDHHFRVCTHYPYSRAHGPSSTLTSNSQDMKKWADAHLKQTMFSYLSYAKAWSICAAVPNNGESVGLGWFIREQDGHTLYGHEGNDDGFRSSFWICPALGTHVTVMSNLTGAPVKKINRQIFSLLTDRG